MVEDLRGRHLNALLAQVLDHAWNDAGRGEMAYDPAALPAAAPEREELLYLRRQTLEPGDLGDRFDPSDAVVVPTDVYEQVDGRHDLLAHRARRQLDPGHEHHRFESRQGIPRRVRVNRPDAAVVPGIERLQHVERLGPSYLPADDAIGPPP